MDKDRKSLTLGGFGLTVLWVFPGAWLNAYTLATLWEWFAVSAGAPAIGLARAYGLALIWFFLAGRLYPTRDADFMGTVNEIASRVITAGAVLGMGWLARTFFL